MPFTFSHPAILLPLTYLPKKWFSLTGLIIGSLTPDLEYFLRMRINSDYSHTIEGLFWFDLPLGILITFIFHNIIRNCLFDNLPTFLKSRFSTFKQFYWNEYFKKNWLTVVISILIGAVSHIFWDSFTHETGYFAQKFSELSNIIGILGSEIPIFKLLQHTSTLLGGLVIAITIYKLPTDKSVISKISPKYWYILLGLTLTIFSIRFLNGLEIKEYGNVIVSTISAGLLSLILTPIILKKL